MPEEPKLNLKLKVHSQHWLFFKWVIDIMKALLTNDNYTSSASSLNSSGYFNRAAFNEIARRFTIGSNADISVVFILPDQVISLMSYVSHICNALIISSGDELKDFIAQQLNIKDKDWDKVFYKHADKIFKSFKTQYENLPQYKEVMKLIEGQ